MYQYQRLKILRKAHNLTQTQVAQILKTTRQQYSLYETGKRELPAYYLKILAKFYHTSSDYILELTDKIKPYSKEEKIK